MTRVAPSCHSTPACARGVWLFVKAKALAEEAAAKQAVEDLKKFGLGSDSGSVGSRRSKKNKRGRRSRKKHRDRDRKSRGGEEHKGEECDATATTVMSDDAGSGAGTDTTTAGGSGSEWDSGSDAGAIQRRRPVSAAASLLSDSELSSGMWCALLACPVQCLSRGRVVLWSVRGRV